MIPTERILEDVEVAATYLRGLIERGVPMGAAVQLTGTYVQSRQIVEAGKDKPREPWEGEGSA